jgi:hypothetical protein
VKKKSMRLLWFALLALLGSVITRHWPVVSFGFAALALMLAAMDLVVLFRRFKR